MTDTLVPTKEVPGVFDALEKAKPDEPIFTLLARDELAPKLVQSWCDEKRKLVMATVTDREKAEAELRQVSEAERIVWAMIDWQRGYHEEEVPTESYSGYSLSTEAKVAEDRQKLLVECARRIDNAVAELTDTAEKLLMLGDNENAAHRLSVIACALQNEAKLVRPKRTP